MTDSVFTTVPANPRRGRILRPSVLAVAAALVLSACGTIQPDPLARGAMKDATTADAKTIREAVEPITRPLSLAEAVARALKYNLDTRAKRMEESLALGEIDTASFDMLPKLAASAGYTWRDVDKSTFGMSDPRFPGGGVRGPTPSISTDRDHTLGGLDLTWSLLDVGLGYYGAKQQADRHLVMLERRRKAAQQLILNVRTAFYRALSAQMLRDDVTETIKLAEEALEESRTAEQQRLRNPIDQLRYQRQLLENLRLLEAINQELVSANIELAQLINAPLGAPLKLVEAASRDVGKEIAAVPVEKLEELTLARNPDLREAHYNARIARTEVRRVMAKLFPNVSMNWGVKYDSDSYLVDKNWQEAGLQLSFNLFNLVTGPTQVKMAEAGVTLADQRRMAAHMAALTQMRLARVSLISAREQFVRADTIWAVDKKIADMVKNRGDARTQSKLDVVSNNTTATLSLLRRYQALSQVQGAENRLLATLGAEIDLDVDKLSVTQLTGQIAYQFRAKLEQLIGLEPLPPLKPGAPLPPPAKFPIFPMTSSVSPDGLAPAVPAATVVTMATPASAAEPVSAVPVATPATPGVAMPASPAEPALPSRSSGSVPVMAQAAVTQAPARAADAAAPEFEVRRALLRWMQAWSSRDVDAYVAAYTPDFKGSADSRGTWLKERSARLGGQGRIDLALSDVEVALIEGMRKAQVRFEQDYKRGAYRSVERRAVAMTRVEDRWLIDAESGR